MLMIAFSFSCLQNVFIGMDIPIYDSQKMADEYDILDIGATEMLIEEDYVEVEYNVLALSARMRVKFSVLFF